MRSEATRASFRVWRCLARLPSRFHVQQADRRCRSSRFAPYASCLLSERPCDLAGAGGTGWRRIGSDQCFPCSLFVHSSDCCLARFPRLALVDSVPLRRRGSSDFISLDLLRQVCIYIIQRAIYLSLDLLRQRDLASVTSWSRPYNQGVWVTTASTVNRAHVAPLYSSFDLVYSPTGVVVDVLNLAFSLSFVVFNSDLKDIIGIRVVCPEIR